MINNLEAYKVFYYVAKCGSVTKAAGELSISQPAVSQAVKQLENTLDVSLFHRAAKGVRLTGEGELLFLCGKRIRTDRTGGEEGPPNAEYGAG